jgi:hypothetical protein
MIRGLRRLFSVGALVFALAAVSGDKVAAGHDTSISKNNSPNTQTAWLIEARLRRLHLVRPDLIPYPIAYEIIC